MIILRLSISDAMITVGIGGGTGNQMFQYTIARSLAHDLNTDFALNLYQYNLLPSFLLKSEKHQRYNLRHFNINENFSSSFKFISATIKRFFNSNLNYVQEGNIFSSFVKYNSDINDLRGDIFLRGNWQNEKYFLHNQDIIRNDFKIVTPPTEKNKSLIDEISSKNSVALCVRRNDYLQPFWKAQLGFTTLKYYEDAVETIIKKVKNPVFYVFSDDPEWVQKNIILDHPTTFITHNDVDKDYEDLRLMSSCKHFIISNSTFHWWGAWLSLNKDKIVIAPEPWLNSYTMDEIIPERWIKIKCDRSELFNQSLNVVFEFKNEKLELDKKQKFKLKAIDESNKYYKSDNFLKLLIDAPKKGILKITSNKLKPIYLGYHKGESERYVCLDKSIPLSGIGISNENNIPINIKYLGIKC